MMTFTYHICVREQTPHVRTYFCFASLFVVDMLAASAAATASYFAAWTNVRALRIRRYNSLNKLTQSCQSCGPSTAACESIIIFRRSSLFDAPAPIVIVPRTIPTLTEKIVPFRSPARSMLYAH